MIHSLAKACEICEGLEPEIKEAIGLGIGQKDVSTKKSSYLLTLNKHLQKLGMCVCVCVLYCTELAPASGVHQDQSFASFRSHPVSCLERRAVL